MLRIDTIIGARTDPAFDERLHRLEHGGRVEIVTIEPGDLDRRRLLAETAGGEKVAIQLPRDQKLFDGAVLFLDDERAIVVRAGQQRWLRIRPDKSEDALELGYHAGNLHWKVRFDGGDLLVALAGPEADYLARIEPLIASGRVSAVRADG